MEIKEQTGCAIIYCSFKKKRFKNLKSFLDVLVLLCPSRLLAYKILVDISMITINDTKGRPHYISAGSIIVIKLIIEYKQYVIQ